MIDNSTLLLISEWLGVAAITTLSSVSLRFKRKPLIFEFPRREGLAAGMLYLSILAVSFIFYAKNPVTVENPAAMTQQLTQAGICALPFIAALFLRKQPFLSAGIGKSNLNHSIRLALVLVFLTLFLRGKVFSLLHGVSSQQGLMLVLILGVSVIEEAIFRGYIQSRLVSWVGTIPGWILCSFLYTIWQIPRFMANPQTLMVNLGISLIQSLLLGYVMLKSGHAAAPAIYRAFSEWMSILG
jgi:membrane protease YdiL (CAAX protease family)